MENTNTTIEFFRKYINKTNFPTPSAVGQWINPILKQVSYGALVVDIALRPDMLNSHQTLHGGMISLFFDEAFGATVHCLEREHSFVSLTLNTDFLSTAKLGDIITVKTIVKRNGKTTINLNADMYNGERIIATSSTVMLSTGKQKKAFFDAL